MDVGATLQGARERSGLTLDEVARRTRISVRILRAIEQNAFDAVPRGIFTRGYLRAYAREVGLDPAATVEQYLAWFDTVTPPAELPSRSGNDHQRPDDALVVKKYTPYEVPSESESEAGKAIAIAFVALGFAAYLSFGTPPAAVDEPPDEVGTAAAPPEASAPAVMLASDPAGPVATSGEILEVEIRPTGPCWVEATADGSRRVYRLMQAGDRETFAVHDSLVLRVGNPGTFAFSVNGRPAHLPGRPGQPIRIQVDGANFTDFLAMR